MTRASDITWVCKSACKHVKTQFTAHKYAQRRASIACMWTYLSRPASVIRKQFVNDSVFNRGQEPTASNAASSRPAHRLRSSVVKDENTVVGNTPPRRRYRSLYDVDFRRDSADETVEPPSLSRVMADASVRVALRASAFELKAPAGAGSIGHIVFANARFCERTSFRLDMTASAHNEYKRWPACTSKKAVVTQTRKHERATNANGYRGAHTACFSYCDNSMRKKDWCCHKRETQAVAGDLSPGRHWQGNLTRVTRAASQAFSRMHTLCFEKFSRTSTPKWLV
jgi:hypothetical protein